MLEIKYISHLINLNDCHWLKSASFLAHTYQQAEKVSIEYNNTRH